MYDISCTVPRFSNILIVNKPIISQLFTLLES